VSQKLVNERMQLMKSALVTGAAAFTGDPQRSADIGECDRNERGTVVRAETLDG
jgi:hypothetical protein